MAEPIAERPLLGYPDTTVSLTIEDRDYRVTIKDHVGLTQWTAHTKYEAKEMYFHPFVYGYEYPQRNGSTETEDDGA